MAMPTARPDPYVTPAESPTGPGAPVGPGTGSGPYPDPNARRNRLNDIYGNDISQYVPGYMSGQVGTLKQRAQFTNSLVGGKGRIGRQVGRLNLLREIEPAYGQPEDQLRDYSLGELGKLQKGDLGVNLHGEQNPFLQSMQNAGGNYAQTALSSAPMLAQLSQYTQQRLGTGLTPEESAAMRGQNTEAVQQSAAEQRRQMGNQFVGSGLDPRAQAAAMGQLANQTLQGRAGVERFMTEQELQRKRDMEALAGNVSGMQLSRLGQAEGLMENARQFDVGAEQAHRASIEGRLQNLAQMANQRREYDLGFIESRRQARANRELMAKMRREAEPTGLEQAAAILGGINAGIGGGGGMGGGGGGGGGGMGSIMGMFGGG